MKQLIPTRWSRRAACGTAPQHRTSGSLRQLVVTLLLTLSSTTFASDLAQRYEKAYFLETAKGQTKEALEIYRQIAATEPTDANRTVINKTLKRMLAINETAEKVKQRENKPESKKELYEQGAKLLNRGVDLVRGAEPAFPAEQEKLFNEATAIFNQLLTTPFNAPEPVKSPSRVYTPPPITRDQVLSCLMVIAHNENDMQRVAELQAERIKQGSPISSVISRGPDPKQSILFLPEGRHTLSEPKNRQSRSPHALNWTYGHLTIKGTDREKCIIEGSSNNALIHIDHGAHITLDSVTLKSQVETYTEEDARCAVWVNGGSMTATNCAFIAPDEQRRSPRAVLASGYGEFTINNCLFEGYERSIVSKDAANGTIIDTAFLNTDYGVDMPESGKLHIDGCLFTGGGQYGINALGDWVTVSNSIFACNHTGANVQAKVHCSINNNLFIVQRHTGLYLSPHRFAHLSHNIFTGNEGYGAKTAINPNTTIEKNIFNANGEAYTVDYSKPEEKLDNTVWLNLPKQFYRIKRESIPHYPVPSTLNEDPDFPKSDTIWKQIFIPQNPNVLAAGHGLSDPKKIQVLWKKYEQLDKQLRKKHGIQATNAQ